MATVKHFGIKDMTLLSPAPDKCQECAVAHEPEAPHNQQSLHYQYFFYQKHERWPTWIDAMAHCSEEVKIKWLLMLASKGVIVPHPDYSVCKIDISQPYDVTNIAIVRNSDNHKFKAHHKAE